MIIAINTIQYISYIQYISIFLRARNEAVFEKKVKLHWKKMSTHERERERERERETQSNNFSKRCFDIENKNRKFSKFLLISTDFLFQKSVNYFSSWK